MSRSICKQLSRYVTASIALVLVAFSHAVAGELEYRLDYDFPVISGSAYDIHGSSFETWRDFEALTAIPSQMGIDYPQTYFPELVGFNQGPPRWLISRVDSYYEFYFGWRASCTESVISPCQASIFVDRFEGF